MKTYVKLTSLLLVILVSSCSSVKVVSDVDQSVDFNDYKTYSFLGWQKDSDRKMNDFDKRRLRDAFIDELSQRGLTYVESGGDMDISLYIVLNQKTSTTAYTDYYSSGYGRYGRYNRGWGHGHSQTTYHRDYYVEGTLVMDVFDGESKEQIWQGIAKSVIDEKPEKREKSIPKKVNSLMDSFPIEVISE